MLIGFLEQLFGVEHSHPEFRFRAFLFSALIVISAAFVFFSFYDFIVEFFLPMLIANLVSLFFCAVSAYYLLIKKRPLISAAILQFVVTIDCFVLILLDGDKEFALGFAFLTPVMGIFLLGYRFGGILSVVNFTAIFYFCITNMDTWEPTEFLHINLIHFSALYLLILIVSIFYDSSRRKAYQMMESANAQLHELATTDALTKLRNRRYLEDHLLGSKIDQYVAMVDVDDFKKINDEFGHDNGDKVLVEIACVLKDNLTSHDLIGRWGGEEFAIIFAEKDLTRLQVQLARLNQSVADHDFGLDRKVTISIGISIHNATTHRDGLRTVDQALYDAKTKGKNTFCIASTLTS